MPWEERRDVVHGGVVYHNQETGVTTRVVSRGKCQVPPPSPRVRGASQNQQGRKNEPVPGYGDIDLGKFHHDLTVLPKPGIMVYINGESSQNGRTIQVSELL